MGWRTVGKALKIIIACVGITILSLTTCIVGMRIERSHQETMEMQKESVSTIAVVNMDDGITMGEAQINYASQLMNFPDDNFTVTGLTDAKSGIENGSYAAYIIIPETFSMSVTSIDNEPRKVTLGYQYNANLDEESELQAVNDVNAFITLLNSNIAYMYMDAILAEFHRVQDDSSTILSNDNTELELLANVNALQLIATAEPVEEVFVENDIKPVELTTYTTQNTVLFESFFSGYSEAAQKGKEDYASIQETHAEVGTATDNFFSTYQAVVEDSALGQAELLDTGRENLADAVGTYNQDIDVKREDVEQIVGEIVNDQVSQNQIEADRQLQELFQKAEQGNDEELNNLQKAWEKVYENIKINTEENLQFQLGNTDDNSEKPLEDIVVDAYTQGFNEALSILESDIEQWDGENDITVEDIQKIIEIYAEAESLEEAGKCEQQIDDLKKQLKKCLDDIHIDWEHLNISLPTIDEIRNGNDGADDNNEEENNQDIDIDKPEEEEKAPRILLTKLSDEGISDATNEILDVFKMESDSEEINQVIETYFVDALIEENRSQMSRLSDAKQQLSQSMDDYESSLNGYDPLQYIENAKLDTYLSDIETNAGEMLDSVEENNSDYMLYATEMYTNTTEHTTLLRSSLDEANKQTTANVENCINELVLSREEVNGQNISMLEGFTDSLKYTRVESQGNAEVYDYIVNPVVSQLNGQTVANTSAPISEKGNPVKMWLIIVLGIGIVICLTEVFINFRRQYKKPIEESEDLF